MAVGSFAVCTIAPLAAWLIVVASPGGPQFVQAGDDASFDQFGRPLYNVPNPFKQRQNGFYFIKSTQSILTNHMEEKEYEVKDYFSLDAGLSFSVHRQSQSEGGQAWVIIGDGQRGRSYIVRNINANDTKDMDCELDHIHNHRQIFPWQYEYDLVIPEQQRKKGGGADETKVKAAIYGVGAIWLNAIERNNKSHQVGVNSEYTRNIWLFYDHHLIVSLVFEKLYESQDNSLGSVGDIQEALDKSRLTSVKVHKENPIGRAQDRSESDGIASSLFEHDNYAVFEFSSGLQVGEVEELQRLNYQLKFCRQSSKKHRIFPNLMHKLNRSPQRLFQLEYITRKYALYNDGHHSDDESRHRDMFPTELVREVFSFTKEAQVQVYKPLLADGHSPDFGRTDTYIKLFSGKEIVRSSRHSTILYHLIEGEDGQLESCKVGEMEPKPKSRIFTRPIHFYKPNFVVLSGHLTGLGAMLLNVADIHYKSFGLLQRKINVTQNADDLDEIREVSVDEWQVADKRTSWTYQFFFERNPKGSDEVQSFDERARGDFSRLVRIDIRNTKAVDVSDSVIKNSGEDSRDDYDLVARFDIVQVQFELDKASYEDFFTPPIICSGEEDGHESDDSDDPGYYFDADDYEEYISANSDNDDDRLHELEQLEGEQFETGAESENHQFPDFFEYIDGQPAYLMTTRLELLAEQDTDQSAGRKHIWLGELVDLEREVSIIDIYYSQQSYEKSKPDEKYYINYNSELVFRIVSGKCKYMDNVDSSWLRLFSDQIVYHTAPDTGGRNHQALLDESTLESNRIRLYGVGALWQRAAQSESSEFLGRKKKLAEKNGTKFKELVWINDEHDMNILFNFLWNVTEDEREHDEARHRLRLPSEHLTLDSILFTNLFADGYATQFRPVKAQIVSLEGQVSQKLLVPDVCADQLREATRMRRTNSVMTEMPSFFDFVNKTGTYYASYEVRHMVGANKLTKSTMNVIEMYDIRANRGRILTKGERTSDIFIEGQQRKVFTYSNESKQCTQGGYLKPLIDLGSGLASENVDFDLKKMYGLAALWIALAEREATVKVYRFFDPSGHHHETHFYNFRLNVPQADGQLVQEVRVVFKKQRQDIRATLDRDTLDLLPSNLRVRGQEKLRLVGITIHPDEKSSSPAVANTGIWSLNINIETITSHIRNDWELPRICLELGVAGTPTSSSFPRLSNILSTLTQFHMKSEVNIQYPDGRTRFYMLDEWVHNEQIRMRARDLNKTSGKDFDFIVYCSTEEVFDINVPFKCPNQLPDPELEKDWRLGLIDLWSSNMSIMHLSHLYYGPLSMWRLAEKVQDKAEVVSFIEIAPRPNENGDDSNLKSMERELRTEIWRITSPKTFRSWSYDMKFIRSSVKAENGTTMEWHALESVQLTDSSDDLLQGLRIFVDVVDYRYHVSPDALNVFLLPEGWGCMRSARWLNANMHWDEFSFEQLPFGLIKRPRANAKYAYEASLEIIGDILGDDNPESGTPDMIRIMSPALSGNFWRGGALTESYHLNFSAHLANINFANGTTLSTKTVLDESKSLIYRIDRMSGVCDISSSQSTYWVLEFPMERVDRVERVSLDEQMFKSLFLNTAGQGWKMVKKYNNLNGFETTTYEKEFTNLKLTTNLYGPAVVVRKFQYNSMLDKKTGYEKHDLVGLFKRRDTISVRVFLYDLGRIKLRAILDITMYKAPEIGLSEFLNEISVVECYNNGDPAWDKQLASFSMDYRLADNWHYFLEQASIKDEFYTMLMTEANLLPTQLDGQARIQLSQHDNLVRIHFNVLEAPSAHVYFKERIQSTMADEMESRAGVKLAASIAECSYWCDQINCVAMSYCQDRTCRVVTEGALRSMPSDRFSDKMVADSRMSILCSYYYRNLDQSVVTLSQFIDLMDLAVKSMGSNKEERNKNTNNKRAYFAISLHDSDIRHIPVGFYASDNKFRWENEDLERPGVEFIQQPLKETVFSTLKRSYSLDVTNLSAINSQTESNYEAVTGHAQSQSECLDVCERNTCSLVSYCKKLSQCVAVTQKDANATGDIIVELKSLMKPTEANLSCSILVQDHLDKYSKFENTSAPASYDKRYDDYSVLECSSACQAARQNCLSFDLCTFTSKFAGQENQVAEATAIPTTVCLLQKSHVALSTFDRSIFDLGELIAAGNSQNTTDNQAVVCDHYSKSVLQDYKRISNKKLANKLDTAVRGVNAEKCAIDCQQDDECGAFEYCYNDKKHPAQACYFIRRAEILDTNQSESDEQIDAEHFGIRLIFSQRCSIFVATSVTLEHKLSQGFHSINPAGLFNGSMTASTRPTGFLQSLLIILGYLIVSIVVGSMIQFAYIRLMGRPILF